MTDDSQTSSTFSCAVCGENAKGYHFGAFTCEGCKSFFGRTCLKKDRVRLMCRLGGDCDVQGENRTSCKSCRFEKCLSVGMSPMNSRFGRRSKYFKVSAAISAHYRTPPVSSHSMGTPTVPLPLPPSSFSTPLLPSLPLSSPSAFSTPSPSTIFPPLAVYQLYISKLLMAHALFSSNNPCSTVINENYSKNVM